MIEGTYRQNNMTLNTSRRMYRHHGTRPVPGDAVGDDSRHQAVAAANATDAIVNGFRVADPAAVVATTAPAAPAAAPALPAAPPPAS